MDRLTIFFYVLTFGIIVHTNSTAHEYNRTETSIKYVAVENESFARVVRQIDSIVNNSADSALFADAFMTVEFPDKEYQTAYISLCTGISEYEYCKLKYYYWCDKIALV